MNIWLWSGELAFTADGSTGPYFFTEKGTRHDGRFLDNARHLAKVPGHPQDLSRRAGRRLRIGLDDKGNLCLMLRKACVNEYGFCQMAREIGMCPYFRGSKFPILYATYLNWLQSARKHKNSTGGKIVVGAESIVL